MPEDKWVNDERVEKGRSLASICKDSTGHKFYLVTESDRPVTTVLSIHVVSMNHPNRSRERVVGG
jgi:hypothetical protein